MKYGRKITSRERRKSAPYQRLKIVKGLQRAKVLVNRTPLMIFVFGKSLTMAKKNFWNFSISILSQNSKTIKGEPFGEKFLPNKNLARPKKLKERALWSRPVFYVTRETFMVQFPGPTGAI